MDINAYPPNNTHLSRAFQRFRMPTDSGGIPAFALSKTRADIMVSVYTLIITFSFRVATNLVQKLVMEFGKRSPNKDIERYLNSWDSVSQNTVLAIPEYIYELSHYNRMRSNREREKPPEKRWKARDTRDLYLRALFIVLSTGLFVGQWVVGVIISQKLLVGNVAPVNPDQVFYPDIHNLTKQSDGAGLVRLASLKMHSALRAIAASEGPGIIARRRVIIERVDPQGKQTGNLSVALNYAYNVTGVDMGLQSDSKLMLRVKGSCHTDYTWLANSTEEGDTYRLWGRNSTYLIKREERSELPPSLAFFLDEERILERSRNLSYAIIANTAGHYSYNPSQDPWYSTEKARTNSTPPYQVLSGRPALSCWETKAWHLNGKDVDNWRLNTLPGLKLHKLWADTVFPFEFEPPRVVYLGRAVGIPAPKPASYTAGPLHILDVGKASIYGDLERLVLGSWISSRNVLRDTTTYDHGNMVNLARGTGGSGDASHARFVLQSDSMSTLSISVAISVPAVHLFITFLHNSLVCWTRA
ncbi:hypothetical protein HOY82DRAFT_632849 [Tuber indicum]|nr:hypothetical protein HOY82DRAFT_632849 [Tuber indicum]